ncbi:AP-5 complex subunit zeta-1-like [Haliotis rufescens]|uniref:AP-5 complex subunit zeta-1-like n=1 Tax=Haliotis rufescens TaxID=6454 RepID=UPI00201EA2EC|nr:AP-5 complex subunit zeta-1-like [Haliotis rufescens]
MALSTLDSLRQQARNASQEDIDKLCRSILETMHISERSGELGGMLRQLCFILQASEEEPFISTKLLVSLLSAVSPAGEKSNPRQCLLCQQIVTELLPCDGDCAEKIQPRDQAHVNKDHLPLYILQGEGFGCLDHSFPEAVRWLSTRGVDLDTQRKAFTFLVSLSMLHTKLASDKIVLKTSEQLSKWLLSASRYQAANPYTKNPFRKDEANLVTEVDGTPSRNFFTVLNIGQYFTDDQFLNIYTFSLLYRWLHHNNVNREDGEDTDADLSKDRETPVSLVSTDSPLGSPRGDGTPQSFASLESPKQAATPVGSLDSTDQFLSMYAESPRRASAQVSSMIAESPRRGSFQISSMNGDFSRRGSGQHMSMRSGTPDSLEKGRQAKVFGSLSSRTVDYCFRVLDQCERKPKVNTDAELQIACLVEAVTVLDLICELDEGHVPRVHQEVKRLYARVSSEAQYAPIVLQILQFFVNHSSAVVHDPGDTYLHYFRNVLGRNFHDPGVAFDTVRFILRNLETLCHRTKVLSSFFPNILKILAWHPRTFVDEFTEILPALMSPTTAMEVFHTVLDLPCLTAALEVIEKAKKIEHLGQGPTGDSEPSNSVEAFQHSFYRPLFSFVTRYDGGHGDTIDKLSSLHNILSDMKSYPRVVVCSQAVPVLVRVWFSVVLEEVGAEFAGQLLPVMLERSSLLYTIPEFQNDIRRLLSENLVALLRKYPSIVNSQYLEISTFLMGTRNFTDREAIFSNLVWCVGELCSLHHDPSCTADLIAKYYETLEAMTYEVSGLLLSAEHRSEVSPKIVSVLISAIAKLSTRCQDLIPRAILCLTKVAKQHYNNAVDPEGGEALVSRAHELINLLKLPNFASVVLNPAADIDCGRWHRDNTALPIILRGTYRLLSPDSK